jgi:hypothetical protein
MEINRSNSSVENYDKHSSFTNGDILTNLSSEYEQRNLPVGLAIKRYELLNSKKDSPQLLTSPTAPINSGIQILNRNNNNNNNTNTNNSYNNSSGSSPSGSNTSSFRIQSNIQPSSSIEHIMFR